jgi:hypothetical protein
MIELFIASGLLGHFPCLVRVTRTLICEDTNHGIGKFNPRLPPTFSFFRFAFARRALKASEVPAVNKP